MTATVKRGAGRPAHAERTNRHAQRTPLPPRPGQVEVAKLDTEVRYIVTDVSVGNAGLTARPAVFDRETARTVKTFRSSERELAERLAEQMNRGDVAETGTTKKPKRTAETVSKAASVAARQSTPKPQTGVQKSQAKPGAAKSGQRDALPDGSVTRSFAKAREFGAKIEPHGWAYSTVTGADDPERTELTARRGAELLFQVWVRGAWLYEESTYTIGDRVVKPRNAKGAIDRFAARSPEVADAEHVKVHANKAWRKKSVEPVRAKLPFDPALSSNEEVISVLLGKTIAWHNRMTQGTEMGTVSGDSHKVEIVDYKGERHLKFCDHGRSGYRACRLNDIIQVGGGAKSTGRRAGRRVDVEELPKEIVEQAATVKVRREES